MNILVTLVLALSSWSQSFTRFQQNQLNFQLVESTGEFINCTHKPLESVTDTPPPPWWVLKCGDRKYTVDIWMEQKDLTEELSSTLLLFHAKEGVLSSGESITRFETQTTEFFYKGKANYKMIRSSIDVRNGLADLYVRVLL